MVKVSMRDQYPRALQVICFEDVKDLVNVASGIDHDSLLGLAVSHDGAVAHERGHLQHAHKEVRRGRAAGCRRHRASGSSQ
eukprot:6194854-Pleurochrysis_carterae.AAC.3